MPSSLKKLIAADGSSRNDNLTQVQREAIVDLLHYCMFADNFVALAEDRFVNSVAATLSWDRNISFEVFESGSIGKARKAKEIAAFREEFYKDIVKRLGSKEAKSLALQLCKDLYNADSKMAEAESQQLAVFHKLLS